MPMDWKLSGKNQNFIGLNANGLEIKRRANEVWLSSFGLIFLLWQPKIKRRARRGMTFLSFSFFLAAKKPIF